MNVFAVNCLASWYDDWTHRFIGVYTDLDKAKEAGKIHLTDDDRKCLWKDLYSKEYWCKIDIIEVELDKPWNNYRDCWELERVTNAV